MKEKIKPVIQPTLSAVRSGLTEKKRCMKQRLSKLVVLEEVKQN